jgi:hypothetical protein
VTQTKVAGWGPAVESEKPIETGIEPSFVNSAPPAATIEAVGFVRSIVVWVRLPSWAPAVQEFAPSVK